MNRFVSPIPYVIRRAAELNPDTGRWADLVEIGQMGSCAHIAAAIFDDHADAVAFLVTPGPDAVPPALVRNIAISEYSAYPSPLVTLQWPEDAEILAATDIQIRARNRRGRWGNAYVTIEATPKGTRVLSNRLGTRLSTVAVTDPRLTPCHREAIADFLAWIGRQAISAPA